MRLVYSDAAKETALKVNDIISGLSIEDATAVVEIIKGDIASFSNEIIDRHPYRPKGDGSP